MSQQANQNGDLPTLEDSVHLTYLVTSSYATTLTVFSRTWFGSEAFAPAGIGAIAVLVVGFLATESLDIITFGVLWFAALAMQRIVTLRNWWRGRRIHSRYGGYPWLVGRLLFWIKDERRLQQNEPLFWLAIGMALLPLSESLGAFILGGAICLFIKTGMELEIRRKQLRQWQDAELEQEALISDWEAMREHQNSRRH